MLETGCLSAVPRICRLVSAEGVVASVNYDNLAGQLDVSGACNLDILRQSATDAGWSVYQTTQLCFHQ